MNNLEALTLPNCRGHEGLGAWYFPCGLVVDGSFAALEALLYPTAGENHLTAFEAPMATQAHRRHHEDQHDEMDQWVLVRVMDPQGQLAEMWCECIQEDAHWQYVPVFHARLYGGGTLYS